MVDERPPSAVTRRSRRRGPRSFESIVRRKPKASCCRQPRGIDLCQSKSDVPCVFSCFAILNLNMRGFVLHRAELEVHLDLLSRPKIVGITETLLDKSTKSVSLTGYGLVSSLDRRDGRSGGGIAVFARLDIIS